MRVLMAWGMLAMLASCSAPRSSPHTAAVIQAPAAATQIAAAATTVRPKMNSL